MSPRPFSDEDRKKAVEAKRRKKSSGLSQPEAATVEKPETSQAKPQASPSPSVGLFGETESKGLALLAEGAWRLFYAATPPAYLLNPDEGKDLGKATIRVLGHDPWFKRLHTYIRDGEKHGDLISLAGLVIGIEIKRHEHARATRDLTGAARSAAVPRPASSPGPVPRAEAVSPIPPRPDPVGDIISANGEGGPPAARDVVDAHFTVGKSLDDAQRAYDALYEQAGGAGGPGVD